MTNPDDVTAEQAEAIEIARSMIAAGIPIFAAPPCPAAGGGECSRPGHAGGREEYDLPPKWQLTVPSEVWLERWRPGWALGAVGGHVADFLDIDPRSGGAASEGVLAAAGHKPQVYGVQGTPSGGEHLVIAPLGERKATPAAPDLPGLDYQGGAPDGQGRGFVWIAPTVKRSKDPATLGEVRPYRWVQPPDLEWLAEGGDESGTMLRTRIVGARAARDQAAERAADGRTERIFTEQQAREFCNITLERLRQAEIGQIEECANAAAAQLSHFVPDFWTEPFAFAVLESALAETAYDPDGPSSWTADKFHAVLRGDAGRAPGDWKAVRAPEPAEMTEALSAEPEPDDVEAMLAEVLTAEQMRARPRPQPLIKGLLNMESESWLIGAAGSKKSFVALDMAGHIARGMPWQGLKVTQGRALIIAAEGAGGFSSRIEAWEKRYGDLGDQLMVLPRPVQSSNAGRWATLVEVCRRLQPVFVVLDTQARMTVGLEENSAKDMGIFIAAIGAIKAATGACVLSVHHTGRNGGDARGSSALDGAQDTELKVVGVAGDAMAGALKVEKQKDLEMLPDLPLHFERVVLGLDDDGQEVTTLVVQGADAWRDSQLKVEVPEAWEVGYGPMQVQIIKVLRDQGRTVGLTKSETFGSVLERFYGGAPRRSKESSFRTAWARVLELESEAGERVAVNVRGEKWIVDEVALEALPPGARPDLY